MTAANTFSEDQLANAVAAIRSYNAVVVAGAGMSAFGFPMTGQLPALVWQSIDAVPAALAQLRAVGKRDGSAKEILGGNPGLLPTAWSLLRAHPFARAAFQTAFAQLDADREPAPAHFDLAHLIRAGRVECVISFNWDTCLERAHQRSYGIPLSAGVLFKPHGDAALPSDEWILPDEPGVVREDVLARVRAMSNRPRTLVVMGYSGSDEVVVDQLLDPLSSRWPVVRIGPSAIGDGALPAGADVALAAIVGRIGDAPLRGWRYVTFDRSRDFSAALRGERLRPSDVDACPELPAAARLAERLANSKYATVSGPSGSGKSITAFHAARRLNREGWAVVELTRGVDASHADIQEFRKIDGRVLAIVDDAQALPPGLLAAFQDLATHDHAVLLVSTVRIEDRDDETLMAAQAKEVIYRYCLQNLDVVGPLISALDDRVRKASLSAETPKRRLEIAESTSTEPWLFMFITSGGDRRIGGALDRIVDAPAVMAVFVGICIGQMLSRDDGITRDDLESWISDREPAIFSDPALARAAVNEAVESLTLERLVVERDGKVRASHVRIAEYALRALGLRGENATNDKVIEWIRGVLIDEAVPPSGKFWLLRTFDHYAEYLDGLIRQMLDSKVIDSVIRQLEAGQAGPERGVGLALVWSMDFALHKGLGNDQALRLASLMSDWALDLDGSEVNGFRWMASGLRSWYPEASAMFRGSISGAAVAALLSQHGSRRRAGDWAELINELAPAFDAPTRDQWNAEFARGVDAAALSGWLADLEPDSHPWEIYTLISVLATIDPEAAQAALIACGPNLVQAFESDLADAGSNFADWIFGIMQTVARLAKVEEVVEEEGDVDDDEPRPPRTPAQEMAWAEFEIRLKKLAAITLSIFEKVDWERSASSLVKKELYELESLDSVLSWLGLLSSHILGRIAVAFPLIWLWNLSKPEEPGEQRRFFTIGRTLHFLARSPAGEVVVRGFLEDHELEIDPFPAILIECFPDIATRCHARGQALEADSHMESFKTILESLEALKREDRATATAYLHAQKDQIRRWFATPDHPHLRGLRAFTATADSLEGTFLGSIVSGLSISEVEATWRHLHAAASSQLRPLLELAMRDAVAVTPLALELISDSCTASV